MKKGITKDTKPRIKIPIISAWHEKILTGATAMRIETERRV